MVTRLVPLESLKSLRQVTKRISMLLAGDLAKEVAAIFRKSTPILQSSFMMIQLYICCASIIGSSPSIRNCCTPHRDTMPPWQVSESGGVVVLQEWLRTQGQSRPRGKPLTRPKFLTGLVVNVTPTLSKFGFLLIGCRMSYNNCKGKRMTTGWRTPHGLTSLRCPKNSRRASGRPARGGWPTSKSEHMVFRLCKTARLDFASAWKVCKSESHSMTAPMSPTACPSARGTSQKTGRKPPRRGLSLVTNLPKFHPSAECVTSSG